MKAKQFEITPSLFFPYANNKLNFSNCELVTSINNRYNIITSVRKR